jgi:hypothetical protein
MPRKPHRSGTKTRYSFSDYRRLSPAELRTRGESPKSKRFVLKSVKNVKRAKSISQRSHETMRVREEYGVASPEIATEARRSDALAYKSAQASETAESNRNTAFEKRVRVRIAKDAASSKRIHEHTSDGSLKTGKRASASGYRLRSDAAQHYFELRRRKLAGEWIDDGDWHWLADMASEYDDPKSDVLRAYPPGYGVRDTA